VGGSGATRDGRLGSVDVLRNHIGGARQFGIDLANVQDARLAENVVSGSGAGIELTGSTRVTAEANDVSGSATNGLRLVSTTASALRDNTARDCGVDGIRVDAGSTGNELEGNTASGGAEHDMHDEQRDANTWSRNTCTTDFPEGTICGR
jgi:parallel beta-helix repeat protein